MVWNGERKSSFSSTLTLGSNGGSPSSMARDRTCTGVSDRIYSIHSAPQAPAVR